MKKNQQGMTFFGVILVGVMIVGGAILVMKLIPAYLEFFSVKKIVSAMANDSSLTGESPAKIREAFDKRAVIDGVTVIKGGDLEITKERGQSVVTANYSVTVPLVGNLSALMDFHASTQETQPGKKID